MELNANGLALFPITSACRHSTWHEIKNLDAVVSKYIKRCAFAVAYLDYGVRFGRFAPNGFRFYPDDHVEPRYLQRIRVFNTDEELLIWRSPGGFQGRLRIDNMGDESVHVIDARQVLFGTDSRQVAGDENYTEIFEKRGTTIILPFRNLCVDIKTNPIKRVSIKTRNYIYYNDLCQAGFNDCRFLGFSLGNSDLE